jgi:hypothetical protein
VVFAREPHPLTTAWRRAVARAAAPFWRDYALHDLAVADKALHARLLSQVADLDQALATENREQLVVAGAALVDVWKEVVAFMQARHSDDGEASGQTSAHDWLIRLAKLVRWTGGELSVAPDEDDKPPPAFEFAERSWGWLMTPAAADDRSSGSIK